MPQERGPDTRGPLTLGVRPFNGGRGEGSEGGPLRPSDVRRPTVPPFALPTRRAPGDRPISTSPSWSPGTASPSAYAAPLLSPHPEPVREPSALDTSRLTDAHQGLRPEAESSPVGEARWGSGLPSEPTKPLERQAPAVSEHEAGSEASHAREGSESSLMGPDLDDWFGADPTAPEPAEDEEQQSDWSRGLFASAPRTEAIESREEPAIADPGIPMMPDATPLEELQGPEPVMGKGLPRADLPFSDDTSDLAADPSSFEAPLRDERPAPLRTEEYAPVDELEALVAATDAQELTAHVLETVARRVRSGEIVVPVDAGASEVVVVAQVLTALLKPR